MKTFGISSNSQVLQWTYSKNGTVASGLDRAWVDQVQFYPTNGPAGPNIIAQPLSQSVGEGTTATFTVAVSDPPPVSYQWLFNGTNILGATAATLTLSSTTPSQSGVYSVIVSNAAGVITSSAALLNVISFSDAVDAPLVAFVPGGSASPASPWFAQTAITHDHVDAAQSGPIPAGVFTKFETHVTGPATVSFWWKVSSLTNSGVLSLTIGSTVVGQISGEVDWQPVAFSVPTGTQLLKWRYQKGSGATVAGQDAGWIDQIVFPGSAPAPPVISTPLVVNVIRSPSSVVLSWAPNPGKTYQVLYKDNLLSTNWAVLPVNVAVTSSTATATDVMLPGQPQRFYLIVEH